VPSSELVQHLTERAIPLDADDPRQLGLEVGDLLHGELPEMFALVGAAHHDSAPVGVVGLDRDQPAFHHPLDALADRLLRDPGAVRQHRGAGAIRFDEVEDASLGASERHVVVVQTASQTLADQSLEAVERGEQVERASIVNHVDNIVNDVYDFRMDVLGTTTAARLRDVVATATGRPHATIATWSCTPLSHRVENMTTRALERYRGELDDGTSWSVVAKTLHPASESDMFATIPPEHQGPTLEALDWRDEPRLYRSVRPDHLPDDLRLPAVYAIDHTGDARTTIWMEDVDDTAAWDLDRYRRTAVALGRMSGRRLVPDDRRALSIDHRNVGGMFHGKVLHHDLPLQAADAFWQHPLVERAVDARHRADVARLAGLMPALIAGLAELPTGLCHGDAAPDNFREPVAGSIVALDWSFGHVGEIGSDLGQLLAGRFEAGTAEPSDIDSIAATILDGFRCGLALEHADVPVRAVEHAWATHLAIRSVFAALLVDPGLDPDDDTAAARLACRAAMARFGLDLALGLGR
jgi:hypothetical protein